MFSHICTLEKQLFQKSKFYLVFQIKKNIFWIKIFKALLLFPMLQVLSAMLLPLSKFAMLSLASSCSGELLPYLLEFPCNTVKSNLKLLKRFYFNSYSTV